MIASGLDPESGPLRIYNWNGYLDPKIKKGFGKEYGVDVQETFFSTTDEAVAKIASGAIEFDVFFPTKDRIEPARPRKASPAAERQLPPEPRERLAVAPGSLVRQGLAVHGSVHDLDDRDRVPHRQGLEDRPETSRTRTRSTGTRRTGGRRTSSTTAAMRTAHMLLKNGITNINTEDPADIELAKNELKSLIDAVNIKLSTDDYTNLPGGKAWVHQMWSGSAVSAQWYLPDGRRHGRTRVLVPPGRARDDRERHDGRPETAKNPVLAHHFLNYLLDVKNGYSNFSNYVGYMPPLTKLDPDRLVADGVVPANLKTAIVRESDFNRGYALTELTPTGQTDWQNAWAEFKAGV